MDDWQKDVERRLVVLETRDAVDVERYANIITRLDKIEGNLSKIVWLILGVIVAGSLKLLFTGVNIPGV